MAQVRRALHGDARTAMGLKKLPNGHGERLDMLLNEAMYRATRAALSEYLMLARPLR